MMDNLNCWEYFKCGRSIFDINSNKRICSVSLFSGINDNSNSGRRCWKLSDLSCPRRKELELSCYWCEFKLLVMKEEEGNFKE